MTAIPTPWRALGRSPNSVIAPSNVNSGALARTGAASEMGKCLSAKYVSTHDRVTTAASAKTNRCPTVDIDSTKSPCAIAEAGAARDSATTGRNTSKPLALHESRTGSTALPCTDAFLATSYRPRKTADKTASTIHVTEARLIARTIHEPHQV